MKTVTFSKVGGPEVLEISETEKPGLGKDEVLIEVHAAGVNRPDIVQRKGLYPPPPGASPILGLEVAGIVVECGSEVKRWKVGDKVCALVNGGGYAEYCKAPEGQCLPIPLGLSMEEAAAIPETYFTVWTNVFTRGKLKAGENILIHGGSSGIGTAAIQLAKSFGAQVYTTAGSDDKCGYCLSLGAKVAINYRKIDFVSELNKLFPIPQMHIILDMVAGEYFPKNIEVLAHEGRLVQIATQKGEQVQLSLKQLMNKCATVTGSTLRPRTNEEKTAIASNLEANVWPLFETKKIKVVLCQVFPMDQVSQAHQLMESSSHMGKIILRIKG